MTTISSSSAYSLSTILSQMAAKSDGAATGAKSGGTSTNTPTTTASNTGSTSIADAIAAAAKSGSYDFATVGKNARTVLDAGIASYGQTPGSQTSDDDWVKIFGGMDRRSLFAVSSNQGGQFSPQEQTVAKQLMDNQVTNAGDADGAATTGQQIAAYSQRVDYLNNVSAEEKKTPAWAYSMADAQTAARMADINARMPQVSGGISPLLSTLMGAMYNVRSQSSTAVNFGSVNSLADITSQSWAKSYSSQIESAFSATYQPGGSFSASV